MNAFINTDSILTSYGYAVANNDDVLIENVPENQFDSNPTVGAWKYVGPDPTDWIAYVNPLAVQQANSLTQLLLKNQAATAMAPVLVSLQLGDATDDETTLAKAWQTYYRDLMAVDLTVAEPAWPTAPA